MRSSPIRSKAKSWNLKYTSQIRKIWKMWHKWGLCKILEYMGLHVILPPGAGQNRVRLRKDIEEYHIAYDINLDETDIDTFIAMRPDAGLRL